MILALMLAGYAAPKFEDDENAAPGVDAHEATLPTCCERPADDPDCMLGADAWVALPGPATG